MSAEGQAILEIWLIQREYKRSTVPAHTREDERRSMTLADVKKMLKRVEVLKNNLKDNDDEEKEEELKNLVDCLEDPIVKSETNRKIKRAIRKKTQRQRQMEKCRAERKHFAERCALRQKEIDHWLETCKNEKKEMEVKKAADETMSEVTNKIKSTEKLNQLMKSLKRLREVRIKTFQGQGIYQASESADIKFYETIDQLQGLLNYYNASYIKEEETLNVMLGREKEEKIKGEYSRRRVIAERLGRKRDKQLDLIYFGKQEVRDESMLFYNYYNQAETDFTSFINIRRAWDAYASHPDDPAASSIPKGWVLPPQTLNRRWKRYSYIG